MNRPVASLIVPTHNRAGILEKSLPLMLAQNLAPHHYEVVLANDGGTDRTPEVAGQCACPGLVYIRLKKAGRAAARNAAIKKARGRILIFLDDDCLIPPDFVESHLRPHLGRMAKPGLLVTGPIIAVPEIPKILAAPGGFAGFHRNPFPTGNASALRQTVLGAGGFREDFTLYGWEDAELAERLLKMGTGRRFIKQAAVFHLKPDTVSKNLALRLGLEKERGKSGAVFYRAHPGLKTAWLTKAGRPMGALADALDKMFGLARKARMVESGLIDPESLSPLMFRLLLFHAEAASVKEALSLFRTMEPRQSFKT